MEEIVRYLNQSISDEMLSKDERKALRDLLAETPLDAEQLNTLHNKVHELANKKPTLPILLLSWSGRAVFLVY